MHFSWIFTFALYINRISGEADYPFTTRCKSISYDVIHATEKTCYTLHNYGKSWRDAKKLCEQLGGNLAVLPNAIHRIIIRDKLTKSSTGDLHAQWWIGAREVEHGRYLWLDGSELQRLVEPILTSGYHALRGWLGVEKTCVALYSTWLLERTYGCMEMFGCICEHDIAEDDENQTFTQSLTLDTRIPSSPPDQGQMNQGERSVTTSSHDDELWSTTHTSPNTQTSAPREENDRSVQQNEETQRSMTLTLLDIHTVEELPVPRVWRNVKYLNLCVFCCHGYYPPYNIMGYNIRTKQCMCYKTGDGNSSVPLGDKERDGAVYYTIEILVH